MPEILKNFIAGLTHEQANELWEYFDGCDISEVIAACASVALLSTTVPNRDSKQ